jgi:hypothetical protein
MIPEVPDPFQWLADSAAKVVVDAWTTAMLGLWNAGLWVLRLALTIVDHLLTPDLSPTGPGAAIYATTFWLAGALVLIMLMVQLGVTALRRDGRAWPPPCSVRASLWWCGPPGWPMGRPRSRPAAGSAAP